MKKSKSKSKSKKKKLTKKQLLSKQKKWWKETVRSDWNNKCAVCGREGENNKLDTHHIIYGESKWTNSNLGILLCSKHHRFSYDSAHKGAFIFYRWFEKEYPLKAALIYSIYYNNIKSKL